MIISKETFSHLMSKVFTPQVGSVINDRYTLYSSNPTQWKRRYASTVPHLINDIELHEKLLLLKHAIEIVDKD